MNYENLVQKTRNFPIFGDEMLSGFKGTKASQKLQFTRWVKAGKLLHLKRGLYALPAERRNVNFSLRWLANTLYSPSYLSLEYALSFYDLIPERVTTITSVSTLKTATFKNPLGALLYRNFKKELFFGFEERPDEFGQSILIATPEKALLDSIYLSPHWENHPDFLQKNLRLQNFGELKIKILKTFAQKMNSKKVLNAVDFLLQEMKK